MRKKWLILALSGTLVAAGLILTVKYTRFYFIPKNFCSVEPDMYRGGQQTDRMFRALLDKYKFKTVVSLTGEIQEQEKATTQVGGKYVFYNWHGSGIGPFNEYQSASLILTDAASRPAFFHCYAGDKRSSAALFAISLAEGMSVDAAFARLEQHGFSRTLDSKLYEYLNEYAAWLDQQHKNVKTQ